MSIIGVVATATLAILIVAAAIQQRRARKRFGKALAGLGASSSKTGGTLRQLSEETTAAVAETAMLIAELEAIPDWRAIPDRYRCGYATYREHSNKCRCHDSEHWLECRGTGHPF